MRANKLFKRHKAEKGSGRTVKVKHLLLPEEVVDDLKMYKKCYEICLSREKDGNGNPVPVRVTYEQMFRRWIDNIGRFDSDVAKMFSRRKEQERLATSPGIAAEQPEKNETASGPADPEKKPWEMSYFFEKDGEKVEALPGAYSPFYTQMNGCNKGMSAMLADGWTLENEKGVKVNFNQARQIRETIRDHAPAAENDSL